MKPIPIVTSSNYTGMSPIQHHVIEQAMEQFSNIIRENTELFCKNSELQAKCEGYEKYIAILEGQIKIAENIILKNNK